ncbi:EAL domain-containing protein [Metapseudomonas otitidis]|uniref:putative bifunctional diguanylate cyclase/phosphodiesterase n=1 Tax=Metapseudomonas otitidis TaxID=319939 RepID=UPI0025405F8A|nr:EAL domain-containing protein [Pseudomonas otitidis]WIF64968.1 EAL domain-containing protein [Pseudomonas otitidis]
MPDTHDRPARPRTGRMKRDIVLILLFALVSLALLVHFDVGDLLQRAAVRHEHWELDEILLMLSLVGWCGFIFGVRRLMEMRWEAQARRSAELKVTRLAEHDMLTGLPNRRGLRSHLEPCLGVSDSPFYFALVDLDGFRLVNDLHSHEAGDHLLQVLARRLATALPEGDLIGRSGADEFTLVLHSQKSHTAASALLEALLELIRQPVQHEDARIEVSATLGVARYPDDGRRLDDLMARAAFCVQSGKREGRNMVVFYEPGNDTELEQQTRLVKLLDEGMKAGYLRVDYQPIVALESGEILGFEALARLDHPEAGSLGPAQFIPAAERLGYITRITRELLQRACEEARQWPTGVFLSFNLSAIDLADESLPFHVSRILNKVGFPPRRLELEVTETAVIDHVERANANIQALQAMGIRVSLDDFGTGYSSLAHISRYNFDKLKIDRQFVAALDNGSKDESILRAMLGLSQELGIPTVAEGIETQRQLEWLQSVGCRQGQGYYFSPPVSTAQATAMVARGPCLLGPVPRPSARPHSTES